MLNNVFNILEARLKTNEHWCLYCMMMFSWISNNQEYNSFDISVVTIKIICISFNKPLGSWFILYTTVTVYGWGGGGCVW